MTRLHVEKIEADRARLGAFGANAVSRGFLGVLGHQRFNSALARSCSRKAERVERNRPATSAQELDSLMSTILTAWIRGCGGSKPNGRGGSPDLTQRQNFRSAVIRKY